MIAYRPALNLYRIGFHRGGCFIIAEGEQEAICFYRKLIGEDVLDKEECRWLDDHDWDNPNEYWEAMVTEFHHAEMLT